MPLSNRQSKYIRSLATRKGRKEHKAFVAEGLKCVGDMLPYFSCQILLGTAEKLGKLHHKKVHELIEVEEGFNFSKLSNLETAQDLLAVFEIPQSSDSELCLGSPSLLLDGVQDPGNMGSIIRTAHWFGLEEVWISAGSADCYGPKVVQAAMGSIGPVRTRMVEDSEALVKKLLGEGRRVIGSFLDSADLYSSEVPRKGEAALLVMGSEGNGISQRLEALIPERITIAPVHNQSGRYPESLNVSVATAIILSEWRRAQGK